MAVSPLRPARDEEVARVWPLVRSARLVTTAAELEQLRRAAPWRLQVGERGEVTLLERWREHLEICAIQGLWVARHEVSAYVADVGSIARAQGFGEVLSPLLGEAALAPYLEAGMTVREPIVALQAPAGLVARPEARLGISVRAAGMGDLGELERIDAECFDEFWRYGEPELIRVLGDERVSVATGPWGELLGYSTCVVRSGSATLGRLAVRVSARGRGVGALLLGEAAEWAEGVGAHTFTLCTQESNETARRLYTAAGMAEVPERYALASMQVNG